MGAHFLTPYTKEKRMCKSSRLGSKTKWQIHKHFMIKSFAQARQCRWLVQMEPTLGHGLVLNSLHSHHLELEKATTFLPIVYYGSLYGDYIEINFFLKTFFLKFLNYESFDFVRLRFFHMSSNRKSSNYYIVTIWC